MSKYNELVKKLKEIFQIDRPELDFGIYRILNSKADDINDYLDKHGEDLDEFKFDAVKKIIFIPAWGVLV